MFKRHENVPTRSIDEVMLAAEVQLPSAPKAVWGEQDNVHVCASSDLTAVHHEWVVEERLHGYGKAVVALAEELLTPPLPTNRLQRLGSFVSQGFEPIEVAGHGGLTHYVPRFVSPYCPSMPVYTDSLPSK